MMWRCFVILLVSLTAVQSAVTLFRSRRSVDDEAVSVLKAEFNKKLADMQHEIDEMKKTKCGGVHIHIEGSEHHNESDHNHDHENEDGNHGGHHHYDEANNVNVQLSLAGGYHGKENHHHKHKGHHEDNHSHKGHHEDHHSDKGHHEDHHSDKGHHEDHHSHHENSSHEDVHAHCELMPNSHNMPDYYPHRIHGGVHLSQHSNEEFITVTIDADGCEPGEQEHAFHVHTYGDMTKCCESLGKHFNPEGHDHGAPDAEHRHVGDFGNVMCSAGTISQTFKIEANLKDLIGRSFALHERGDDMGHGGTDASRAGGDAGAKVACCVIGWSDPATHADDDNDIHKHDHDHDHDDDHDDDDDDDHDDDDGPDPDDGPDDTDDGTDPDEGPNTHDNVLNNPENDEDETKDDPMMNL